ncbi:MAG: hypothetical protein Q7U16_14855 [Agitococcus sp.]|nr:hypothetical protein [Agitococcus sp.]
MKSFAKTYWWVFLFIALYAGYVYMIMPHGPADYCEEQKRYLTNEELTKGLKEELVSGIKEETKWAIQSSKFKGIEANTTAFFQKYPHLIWVDRNASRHDIPISVHALYFFTLAEKEQFNQERQKVKKGNHEISPPQQQEYKAVIGISYDAWLNGCGHIMETIPQYDLIEENSGWYAKQNPYQNNLK